VSRQSRVALAAIVGLLVGLGTLAGVVLALRDFGGGDESSGIAPTDVADTGSTDALVPVETNPAERTRTIDVGGFPNAVAVGGRAVWVVRDGRRLIRIDPATATVVARVGAGDDLGSERACGIAVGGGAVWVATLSGNVARINPETNRVARLIPVEDAGCVAVGAAGVWVTSPNRGVVTRIDPVTNEDVAEIDVGGFPQGVTTGFGSVWVALSDPPDGGDGAVLRIDRRTNEVSTTIPVAHLPEYLATGATGIWVSANDGTVRRVDPRSNELVEPPVEIADTGRTTLAIGAGFVWATTMSVAGGEAFVRQVDATTEEPVGDPIPIGETPVGLAFGSGALWVTNYEAGTVTTYAP